MYGLIKAGLAFDVTINIATQTVARHSRPYPHPTTQPCNPHPEISFLLRFRSFRGPQCTLRAPSLK